MVQVSEDLTLQEVSSGPGTVDPQTGGCGALVSGL